jgi:hypothetical protein
VCKDGCDRVRAVSSSMDRACYILAAVSSAVTEAGHAGPHGGSGLAARSTPARLTRARGSGPEADVDSDMPCVSDGGMFGNAFDDGSAYPASAGNGLSQGLWEDLFGSMVRVTLY